MICIIADLNMSPEGLTSEQKQRTQGAVLTGWVWLHAYVWAEKKYQDKQIIFYSAFTNILKSSYEYKTLKNNQRKNIKLVNKSEFGIEDLCRELIVLCK